MAGLLAAMLVAAGCFESRDKDRATSTSTSLSTSTSVPVPPPSARLAVVVAPYVVAGWWDGHGWVEADGKQPVPVSGGERYSIIGVSGPVTTGTGSAAQEGCETDPGTSRIKISGMDLNGVRPGPIAVSGVGNPRPRPTTVLDSAAAVYREAAASVLTERGVADQDADVVQVLRADLEGDGTDEVVLVAERIGDQAGLYAKVGDYSLVLLRRLVNGTVVTTGLAESVPDPRPDTTSFIYSHRVSAIADLNGDGRMELVLELRQYEGIGLSVHELQPDGSMRAVLSADCGA